MGPYIDALMVVKEGDVRQKASAILHEFLEHLNEACIGSISEIFDAEQPHTPRGCTSQAWGVAEILRVAVEYNLLASTTKRKTSMANTYSL